MAATTIKVDSAVRDRLAGVARARGITMTALLQQVSEELETEQRWNEIEAAYGRLQRQDPRGWTEYLGELHEWDKVPVEAGEAAAEWPEYNG